MWKLYLDDTLMVSGLTTQEALAALRNIMPMTTSLVRLVFDASR